MALSNVTQLIAHSFQTVGAGAVGLLDNHWRTVRGCL
jgi:hypothetical protein